MNCLEGTHFYQIRTNPFQNQTKNGFFIAILKMTFFPKMFNIDNWIFRLLGKNLPKISVWIRMTVLITVLFWGGLAIIDWKNKLFKRGIFCTYSWSNFFFSLFPQNFVEIIFFKLSRPPYKKEKWLSQSLWRTWVAILVRQIFFADSADCSVIVKYVWIFK